MAITTSRGYPGVVTASDYAILSRHQGQTYAILGHDHFVASAGTGDRGISISTGIAVGNGVMTENTGSPINVNATPMLSAGSRWDTVAIQYDWVNKATSVVVLPGTSAKAISGLRQTNVGTGIDHQPIWLVRVENGFATIREWVDLRVWQQDSGLYAADPMARDYMTALGTDMLCKSGVRYIRVLDQTSGLPVWSEHRAAAFGPRPTAYARRGSAAFRQGPVAERLGFAESMNFYDGGADALSWVSGDFGATGAQFIVKRAGMYSLWGNATISSSGSLNATLTWGSSHQPPLGGLPGSSATPDAPSISATLADVSGDALFRPVLETYRYLDVGSVISLTYLVNTSCIIENWQMWAQRVSD